MAFESFRITHNYPTGAKKTMMYQKRKQVKYLYDIACDREDNCLLNNKPFCESPRVFNRQIKTNYYQTVNVETIHKKDRFKSGDLLFYDNDYWICTSSFVFHDLYCKGNFIRTNYTLEWQNDNGEIVERRAYVTSASQYNSGEEGNKTITIGYKQYMIVLPSDSETNVLNRTKRFFIDKNVEHPIPYRITRNDTVPYSDWDRGCVCLVVTEDQFNEKTDSIEEWICDYIKPKEKDPVEIIYSGKAQIRCGGAFKTFSIDTDKEVTWNIQCLEEQSGFIEINPIDNKCKVRCTFNEMLIGTCFKLIAQINDDKIELLIDIVGGV